MGEEDWCSNKQLLKDKETNRNDENVCTQRKNNKYFVWDEPSKKFVKETSKKD